MSNPLPSMPAGQPTIVPVPASSSVWDRVSTWASENKAVVYTIAGVVVAVTGAGAVYYLTSDAVCHLMMPKELIPTLFGSKQAHQEHQSLILLL